MDNKIYGGIEGGGTKSVLALIKEDGNLIGIIEGPHTNHWFLGFEKCVEVIHQLIENGYSKFGLDKSTKLQSLGLCLSGCEEESSNEKLKAALLSKYPNVAHSVSVASDTIASMLTGNPSGGVIIIAGTGSNSLLLNEDGSVSGCGGWGHVLGDEGGAYWISNLAVRSVFNSEDNFNVPKYDCSKVKEVMMEHFNVTDKIEMLKHCYTNFDKSFFASMCVKLANVAREDGDPLSRDLFRRAGYNLGKYVQALSPNIKKDFSSVHGGLPIVVIGSVFKSWDLLKDGFLDGLDNCINEFTMYRLTVSAAIGSVYFGAKKSGVVLPMDFSKHVTELFHSK